MTMQSVIHRRIEHDGQTVLTIGNGASLYNVTVIPARGINNDVVGYSVTIANATRLHPTVEMAVKSALGAIDRICAPSATPTLSHNAPLGMTTD